MFLRPQAWLRSWVGLSLRNTHGPRCMKANGSRDCAFLTLLKRVQLGRRDIGQTFDKRVTQHCMQLTEQVESLVWIRSQKVFMMILLKCGHVLSEQS